MDPVNPFEGIHNLFQHRVAERNTLLHPMQMADPSIAEDLIPMARLSTGLPHHCSPTTPQDVVLLLHSASQQYKEALADQGLDPPLGWVPQGAGHLVPGQSIGSSQHPFQ